MKQVHIIIKCSDAQVANVIQTILLNLKNHEKSISIQELDEKK